MLTAEGDGLPRSLNWDFVIGHEQRNHLYDETLQCALAAVSNKDGFLSGNT